MSITPESTRRLLRLPVLAGLAGLCASSFCSPCLANGVAIGRSAGGSLVVGYELPQPLNVEPSVFPEFPGHATGLWGFESAENDVPDEDLFMLSESAQIEVVLVGGDEAVRMYDGSRLVTPGDTILLGNPAFDFHPIFNIVGGEPGQLFTLRFIARDLSGTYSPSAEFEWVFRLPCDSPCVADYDNSGGTPDSGDIDAFFADWLNGATCADADNSGGTPDSGDIDAFFATWLAGGC